MSAHYARLARLYTKDDVTLENEANLLGRFTPGAIESRLESMVREVAPGACLPRVSFVEHHRAHAASAFYSSGFDSAAVLTADGSGEEITVALWQGSGVKLRRVGVARIPDSLGWFYAAFVEYLGLRPYLDEGKLMALAGFGRPNPTVQRVVDAVCSLGPDGVMRVDPYFTFYGGHRWGLRFTDALVEALGPPRCVRDVFAQEDADIAYAVQHRLEEVVLSLLRIWLPRLGTRRLCLAGGVAMNCLLNGAIGEAMGSLGLTDLFVQPVSNDAGTALGAAQHVSLLLGDDSRLAMTHLYFGPEFSDEEVRAALRRAGVKFTRVANPASLCAGLIATGAVVGWFQGRMEVGPRALGNRSILADATDATAPVAVNRRVKGREWWRPFAPSLQRESADEYLEAGVDAPFMVTSRRVRPAKRSVLPAVVHVDGSTRPQIVERETNPLLWDVLEHLRVLRGVPVVLNTSLNGPGQPISCQPDDAIELFVRSEMDALVIGSYVLTRGEIYAQLHHGSHPGSWGVR